MDATTPTRHEAEAEAAAPHTWDCWDWFAEQTTVAEAEAGRTINGFMDDVIKDGATTVLAEFHEVMERHPERCTCEEG